MKTGHEPTHVAANTTAHTNKPSLLQWAESSLLGAKPVACRCRVQEQQNQKLLKFHKAKAARVLPTMAPLFLTKTNNS
eukprot:373432-Pleurochrysis_carterae.AAC.1